MPLSADERSCLDDGGRALGVALDGSVLEAFGRFLDLLQDWNRRVNLVGTDDRRELLARHLLDSLAAVPIVRCEGDQPRILDLGSGAGLPGVPVALTCPDAAMTLLEPRRKKANFLRAVARECFTWNIAVEELRAQDLVPARRFEIVMSRAALPPARLPAVARPLLAAGGLLIAFTTAGTKAPREAPPGFNAPEIVPYGPRIPGAGVALTLWRAHAVA